MTTADPASFSLLDPVDRLVLADLLAEAGREPEADLARSCPDPTRLAWEGGRLVARPWTTKELTDEGGVSLLPFPPGDRLPAVRQFLDRGTFDPVGGALDLDREDWMLWVVWSPGLNPAGGSWMVPALCWATHVELRQ